MRVGINAQLLYSPSLRGWNRYTVNLLSELSRMDVELVLYSNRPLLQRHLDRLRPGSYEVRTSTPMRYFLWEQYWLPRQCAVDGVDLLHTPFNYGLPVRSPCPRVLTLHDAIDYAYYRPLTPWPERLSAIGLRNSLTQWIGRIAADHFITVSEHAKRDLIRYFGIRESNITVTYEAADGCFHQPASTEERAKVRHDYSLDEPFVLYAGGWEKRKNVAFLLEAFAAARLEDVELVLVGGDDGQISAMRNRVQMLGAEAKVRLLGMISDLELRVLYSQALCFVYPSEYEGFGLQLCEAMAAGCPIFASRGTSLSEILGDGGECFHFDVGELTSMLRRIVSDTAYRSSLAERASRRSKHFSWHQTASKTLSLYHEIADRKSVSCQTI